MANRHGAVRSGHRPEHANDPIGDAERGSAAGHGRGHVDRIASQYAEARQTPEFQTAAQAHPDQVQLLSGGHGSLNDTSFLSRVDDVLAHPFRAGFSRAMDLVFITGAFGLLLAVVLSLCIREVPLHHGSGMEAVRMEAEAAHASDAGGATH